MKLHPGRLVSAALTLALAASATGFVPAGASAPAPAEPAAEGDLLPAPANGRAAVRGLGTDLATAAQINDMSSARLRDLLLSDSAVWVDPSGRLLYKDPLPTRSPAASAPDTANYPLEDTFKLHSKPGSQRTIFLDFDGHVVSGTVWNSSYGVASGYHPPFTIDGDGTTFNTTERTLIQSVFDRVAEDFAPFDVDVTTEDPGEAALHRSDGSDQLYGSRALISPSTQAAGSICGNSCGGVAFVGVFNLVGNSQYSPAWVFPHLLGNDAKNIAEAATHEVGHNLNLLHDGNASEGYDTGHANWAPIMGVGYYRPVVHWSKGEYAGANNQQDDLAVMTTYGLPQRADEAGGTVGTAADELPTGPAYISTREDKDVFLIGQCNGEITLAADGAPFSPNLDIELRLLNSSGGLVAIDNPTSGTASPPDIASGMDASITHTVSSGVYYAQVDGIGTGDPITGYNDYGSLGMYTLSLTGPCSDIATEPDAPQSVSTSTPTDALEATIQWSPPASDGGSAITGYTVSIDGSPTDVGPGASSYTFTGLAPGETYALAVAAYNAVGTGPSAGGNATTKDYPGAPTSVSAVQESLDEATISWSPPSSDGGSPITGYQVSVDGGSFVAAGGSGEHTFTGLSGHEHTLAVRAVNGIGAGPAESAETTFYTVPGLVQDLAADLRADAGEVDLTWSPPADDGGQEVSEYWIYVNDLYLGSVGPDSPGVTLTGLSRGSTYEIGVAAVNAEGEGPMATVDVVVPATNPDAPRMKKAKSGKPGGKKTAIARWAPPVADGGAAITGYKVWAHKIKRGKIVKKAKTRMLSPSSRAVQMNLKGGTWRFVMKAKNAEGWSPWSRVSNKVRAR
ncbi:fibronectin type III domain-containing protein [Nocardioides sp.]|uniref:fibronectin type III domain-containing protein n=1 Tax=Nocardioides sp. TaxID=35761 RepID=UPI00356162D7